MRMKKTQLNENQFRILDVFTRGFDKGYYVREISKLLNIGPRTAQLNLEALESLGILESETRGKIKVYTLQKNKMAQEYLKFAEIFKNIRFLEKNNLIKEVINKLDFYIEGIGLIFGSYAKGTEKKGSDLDILVIGKYKRKEISRISKTYGIEISVKNYPLEIFKKSLNDDILIKEILNNHIIFKGAEEFIGIVLKNG